MTLEKQLQNSEKLLEIYKGSIINTYSDFDPDLEIQIDPLNFTRFGGLPPSNNFRFFVLNDGVYHTSGKTTWEFYPYGCDNRIPAENLPIKSVEVKFSVPKKDSESSILFVTLPEEYVNALTKINNFVVRLNLETYPKDPTIGEILEHKKYHFTLIQFDYDPEFQRWEPYPQTLSNEQPLCDYKDVHHPFNLALHTTKDRKYDDNNQDFFTFERP
ncbi:MAG: hypothetical protein WD154_03945 [Nitrosopumilaceae archaeon]